MDYVGTVRSIWLHPGVKLVLPVLELWTGFKDISLNFLGCGIEYLSGGVIHYHDFI
ncbi:hypothetical protein LCGC14_1643290 [marine sediment metagenome]|uniref:Uncharacterized protein n=1 Tax=marine sediment metagenome TaxID=412755 RepID=A0A0F9HZR9_9ZZZZ